MVDTDFLNVEVTGDTTPARRQEMEIINALAKAETQAKAYGHWSKDSVRTTSAIVEEENGGTQK